jgi:hypothetical protein
LNEILTVDSWVVGRGLSRSIFFIFNFSLQSLAENRPSYGIKKVDFYIQPFISLKGKPGPKNDYLSWFIIYPSLFYNFQIFNIWISWRVRKENKIEFPKAQNTSIFTFFSWPPSKSEDFSCIFSDIRLLRTSRWDYTIFENRKFFSHAALP